MFHIIDRFEILEWGFIINWAVSESIGYLYRNLGFLKNLLKPRTSLGRSCGGAQNTKKSPQLQPADRLLNPKNLTRIDLRDYRGQPFVRVLMGTIHNMRARIFFAFELGLSSQNPTLRLL